MSDTLDDADDLESSSNTNNFDVPTSLKKEAVSKKKQGSIALDARIRVELKLEEVYIRKETEAYYFDYD